MKIAVISDIHGNSAALDAVLSDIERRGISRIVNLGDTISGPLDPKGTAARLLGANIPTVSGNHDRWLYDPPDGNLPLWEQWTLPHIGAAEIDWLKALPATREVDGVLLTHGTPESDCENWLHRRAENGDLREAYLWEAAAPARGFDNAVILSGHTHMSRIARLPGGQLLLNPGSVGCPAYRDPRFDPPFVAEAGSTDARYGVLERVEGVWRASLHAVPYDASAMIQMARALDAELWCEALSIGWMRPAPEEGGSVTPPASGS
ncbi:MAG: metallophosphoesterase family protein [Pseudomonadota bacterium]